MRTKRNEFLAEISAPPIVQTTNYTPNATAPGNPISNHPSQLISAGSEDSKAALNELRKLLVRWVTASVKEGGTAHKNFYNPIIFQAKIIEKALKQ